MFKQVEKITLYGNFSFQAEFPRLFSVTASEATVWRCSIKKVILKISQISQKTPCQSLIFNKAAIFSSYSYTKISEQRTNL